RLPGKCPAVFVFSGLVADYGLSCRRFCVMPRENRHGAKTMSGQRHYPDMAQKRCREPRTWPQKPHKKTQHRKMPGRNHSCIGFYFNEPCGSMTNFLDAPLSKSL